MLARCSAWRRLAALGDRRSDDRDICPRRPSARPIIPTGLSASSCPMVPAASPMSRPAWSPPSSASAWARISSSTTGRAPAASSAAKGALSFPADGYTLVPFRQRRRRSAKACSLRCRSISRAISRRFRCWRSSTCCWRRKWTPSSTPCRSSSPTARQNPGKLNFGSDRGRQHAKPFGRAVQDGHRRQCGGRHLPHHAGTDDRDRARRCRCRLRLLRGVQSDGGRQADQDHRHVRRQAVPLFSGVPTVKDSGYPDYVVTSWNAISARAGTPADIIAKLNGEISAVLRNAGDRRAHGRTRHGASGEHARGTDATPEGGCRQMARGHR